MVDQKSFLDTANGAIKERCDLVLAQIFDNIMDPNTRAEKKAKAHIDGGVSSEQRPHGNSLCSER